MFIKNIKSILKLSEINRVDGIIVAFYSLILSILDLFSIGFLALVVTRIFFVENQDVELSIFKSTLNLSSINLVILLFFSVILKFVATFFVNKVIFKISNEKQHLLRLKIFKLFSKVDFLKFQEKSPNIYIAVVGNHIKTFGSAFSTTILFFGEILFFLFLLAVLLFVNFKVTLFLMIFFIIFFFIYSKVKILNPKQVGFETKEAYKSLYDFVINFFGSFKEIKIYNKFETINSNLKNYSDKIFSSDLKNNLLSILPRLLIEFIIVIFFTILLFFTLKFNLNIFSNLEYFSILLASVIRILPFFIQILRYQNNLRYSDTFIQEINENINFLTNFQVEDKKIDNQFQTGIKKITFKNITYSYGEKKIINNSEFNIEIDKFTSITGESGSGKTTLLNIVCGFIKTNIHNIYINDKLLNKDVSISNLIAYVPQDKFVFEGEVWKNISLEYNKNNCDLLKIEEVLNLARLKIDKDFVLYSNGQNLSGGQKQRLIIARALYFSKKIIILDESTNELDQENEEQILNDIKKIKGVAVIIVSHKKSAIRLCDKRYNLINKKLILQ